MKKETKTKIKRILVIAAITNYFTLPLASSLSLNVYSPQMQDVHIQTARTITEQKLKISLEKLPSDLSAFEYVLLANNMTGIAAQQTGKKDGTDIDCKDYAITTLNLYNQLVRENNRSDLEGKVNLVMGIIQHESGQGGHAWLEIDGQEYFECTQDITNFKSINQLHEYARKERQNYNISNIVVEETSKGINGSKILIPRINTFTHPGGAIQYILACPSSQ